MHIQCNNYSIYAGLTGSLEHKIKGTVTNILNVIHNQAVKALQKLHIYFSNLLPDGASFRTILTNFDLISSF